MANVVAPSPRSLRGALRRQRVLTVALVALGVIVVVGAMGHVPLAGVMLAFLLTLLALARIMLPVQAVGALAVRSRAVDASVLLALAVGLALLAGTPNL
ncbi:DUF3017 domain-containing protein [Brachybacterium timonense]|uniref:DUF3017 domain-containing protein n=1 Tax=Brachybacterium timonense TaxID=2050896 RepID=UPI000D0B01A2